MFQPYSEELWGQIIFSEKAGSFNQQLSPSAALSPLSNMAHEIGHQWVGDLVTCAWWTDIWLNEGFANFIETIGVRAVYNNSDELFWILSQMNALKVDSDQAAKAVVVPLVNNIDAIMTGSLNPTIYDKGACMLSMVRWILGETVFRNAMADYLTKYAYQSANTDDFLLAMEKYQAGIRQHMGTWIYGEGLPMLTITRPNADTVQIQQSRFTFQNAPSNTQWHVPVWYMQVFQNYTTITSSLTWLTQANMTIAVASDSFVIIVNPDAKAFLRTNYDSITWQRIAQLL